MKALVENTVTVNRVASHSPVWHRSIDSGAQRIMFSNREFLHDFVNAVK